MNLDKTNNENLYGWETLPQVFDWGMAVRNESVKRVNDEPYLNLPVSHSNCVISDLLIFTISFM